MALGTEVIGPYLIALSLSSPRPCHCVTVKCRESEKEYINLPENRNDTNFYK